MAASSLVLATASAFVATHFILSHPLRRPLVRVMGEKVFLALYSLIAFATLGATAWAYRSAAPTTPLWQVGDGMWAFVTIAMLLASILLLGSLIRNPAAPGAIGSAATAKAYGVYAVTRHPMMWSFAIWGACHILIYPVTKNIYVAAAMIVLALVGAALQNRKKVKQGAAGWSVWESRTSYFPFVAIAQRRATFSSPGAHAIGGGIAVWLLAIWAHIPIAGWPAGIWRWLQ